MKRRSYRNLISAFIMTVVSILPYIDLILGLFIDLKSIIVPRFANLSYAIWAYSTAVSPMLVVVVAFFLKPPKWSYFTFFFINISQVIAYVLMQMNLEIDSIWLFRGLNFIITLVLFVLGLKAYNRFQIDNLKEDLMEEFIKAQSDYESKN